MVRRRVIGQLNSRNSGHLAGLWSWRQQWKLKRSDTQTCEEAVENMMSMIMISNIVTQSQTWQHLKSTHTHTQTEKKNKCCSTFLESQGFRSAPSSGPFSSMGGTGYEKTAGEKQHFHQLTHNSVCVCVCYRHWPPRLPCGVNICPPPNDSPAAGFITLVWSAESELVLQTRERCTYRWC